MRSPVRPLLTLLLSLLAVAALASCARCAPEAAAMGAARLSVRNAGAIASLLKVNESCGFASPTVLGAAEADGDLGMVGTVTLRVVDCEIDLGEGQSVSTDCLDRETRASGKVTVTATQRITGRITGNPETPAIPGSADAVVIEIEEATLDRFRVEVDGSDNVLTQVSGSLAAMIQPVLAQAASSGFCAVALPRVAVSGLVYTDALLAVESPTLDFDVEVQSSDISAQAGPGDGSENALTGTITVWGQEVSLPAAGDDDGLDPEYDPELFAESYACLDDLQLPVSEACDPQAVLGLGAARLTPLLLGSIAKLVDQDTECGFSSDAVLDGVAVVGEVGQDGATATYTISSPCTLVYTTEETVTTNCYDVATLAQGGIEVTGTKVVRGFATGHPDTPVVPTSWRPATVTLQVTSLGFEVSYSDGSKALTMEYGGFEAEVASMTAISAENGACSVPLPVITFSDVVYRNTALSIDSSGNKFRVEVDSSRFDAQSGFGEEAENAVSGSITLDGVEIPIPEGTELDPTYDPIEYESSYACLAGQVVPQRIEECTFRRSLGQVAGREAVRALQTAARLVDLDDTCGFQATSVLESPEEVTGEVGADGSVRYAVEACSVDFGEETLLYEDCTGNQTFASGRFTVSATKEVRGERDTETSAVPQAADAVTITITDVTLDAFSVREQYVTPPTKDVRLTLSGVLSGVVAPVAGERADAADAATGVFDIPTPVAAFSEVVVSGGQATVEIDGMTFQVAIDDSALVALRGAYTGEANFLRGTIVVDSQEVELPVDRRDPSLEPDYDAEAFTAGYACAVDLYAPVPSD